MKTRKRIIRNAGSTVRLLLLLNTEVPPNILFHYVTIQNHAESGQSRLVMHNSYFNIV